MKYPMIPQPQAYMHNGTPIVLAFQDGNQLIFWCAYCKLYHRHGNKAGYRDSHCAKNPTLRNGYYLDYYTKTKEAIQ